MAGVPHPRGGTAVVRGLLGTGPRSRRRAELHPLLPVTPVPAWTIHPGPPTPSTEKPSSTKPVPGAKKAGDRCSIAFAPAALITYSSLNSIDFYPVSSMCVSSSSSNHHHDHSPNYLHRAHWDGMSIFSKTNLIRWLMLTYFLYHPKKFNDFPLFGDTQKSTHTRPLPDLIPVYLSSLISHHAPLPSSALGTMVFFQFPDTEPLKMGLFPLFGIELGPPY